MPSCSTMNSNSKPTSGLNSFSSKYQRRISSTSVIAFQTRATGAVKVRSMTTASAKLDFVVMIFSVQLFRFGFWLQDPKHVAGRICRVGQPTDTGNRHLRHTNLSTVRLKLFYRLLEERDR